MKNSRKSFLTALSALLLPLAAAADDHLLLSSSFDRSPNADYARGDGRGITGSGMSRKLNGTLRLPWNQWLCYAAPGNISLEAGTILMRVKLDFQPGRGALPKGWTEARFFSIRNRVGHRLQGLIDDRNGFLYFYSANNTKKTTAIKVDVRNWKPGEWRNVTFAWKQPGFLYLGVEGLGEKSIQNALLPDCPLDQLHDLYIGANSQALPIQQYGRLNTLRGEIDELRVYDDYRPQIFPEIPACSMRTARPAYPADTADPTWIGPNRRRANFYLTATEKQWRNNPVTLELNLPDEFRRLSPEQFRAAADSIRVVAFDPASGKPLEFDVSRKGEERYYRPFQTDVDFYGRRGGSIHLSHSGALPVGYSVYFDENAPYDRPFPETIPLAGTGEPLRLGVKGQPGMFSGGLRGNFDLYDFDGDGDLDMLFMSGSETDSGRDLFGGLYFYENLRNERGYDLFAPPVRLYRGNHEFGTPRNTATPHIVDVDGDGKMDVLFANQYFSAWAPIRFENGTPEPGDFTRLKFDGKTPPLVSSAAIHDFNGDGLPDIFCDGECYYNLGNGVWSSRGADLFAPGVRGGMEQSKHRDVHAQRDILNNYGESIRPLVWTVADINGDGRSDLVCGGWKSLIYYFPADEQGKFGKPVELRTHCGHEIDYHGVFPCPLFRDLNGDGALDLLISNENASLAICYNIARPGEPVKLLPPVMARELQPHMNAGSICVPVSVDWDQDGDLDVLVGGADAYIWYFENVGTSAAPIFREPRPLLSGNMPIILRAGPDGSVQGDQENDWGYLNIAVADWDGDGLQDLLVSGVRGDHTFFRNIGTPRDPRLAPGELITVDYPGETPYPGNLRFKPRGKELLTAHRCRPAVTDFNGDGLMDYITQDHRDKLVFYERYRRQDGSLGLKPGAEIFELQAPFFRSMVWNHQSVMNLPTKSAQEGRSVIQILDWNHDGKPDLLMDNINARLFLNVSDSSGKTIFKDQGDLADKRLANHNAAPYASDWDGDGWEDLIVGTESGWIYYFSRPFLEKDIPGVISGPVQQKKER